MMIKKLLLRLSAVDEQVIALFNKYGHGIHRISIGVFIAWMGLLKLVGYQTNTAIIAEAIYWGDPEVMTALLGYWEIAIGLCLMMQPLVRVAILLLLIRLPGIILAFILKADICFDQFPFAPTIEGQYLIKDFIIFFAAAAIAGDLHEKRSIN